MLLESLPDFTTPMLRTAEQRILAAVIVHCSPTLLFRRQNHAYHVELTSLAQALET
jgi:hypothetical protein